MARSGLLGLLDENYKNNDFRFVQGTIDPNYLSGKPSILFDDGTLMTSATHPYLESYTPVAGDRVLCLQKGLKTIILGKIVGYEIIS